VSSQAASFAADGSAPGTSDPTETRRPPLASTCDAGRNPAWRADDTAAWMPRFAEASRPAFNRSFRWVTPAAFPIGSQPTDDRAPDVGLDTLHFNPAGECDPYRMVRTISSRVLDIPADYAIACTLFVSVSHANSTSCG
jgi:hypothetical protein